MPGFLIRLLINAAGLWLADTLLAGLVVHGAGTLILAALLLGIVNALVRPVVVFLTLPLTVVTLGLFLFVVNAAMLGLVAALLDAFVISSFSTALLGSLIVSFVSWCSSHYVGSGGRIEVMIIRR